jgi:hypothetical protein
MQPTAKKPKTSLLNKRSALVTRQILHLEWEGQHPGSKSPKDDTVPTAGTHQTPTTTVTGAAPATTSTTATITTSAAGSALPTEAQAKTLDEALGPTKHWTMRCPSDSAGLTSTATTGTGRARTRSPTRN